MTQPLQHNLKGLPYAPAECVKEKDQQQIVETLISKSIHDINDSSVLEKFLTKYKKWITSSKLNTVIGLDTFNYTDFIQGTSEGFDKFYIRHHTCRFRCFRGEYMYHRLCWATSWPNQWAYLDESQVDLGLEPGDAVIVSYPFADLGDPHPRFNKEFLDRCFELNIPVLVDSAFFGICGNLTLDYSHPAIEEICFSLSKAFPVNSLRIGMRLRRDMVNDGITIYNSSQYINQLSAAVGAKILDIKGPDDTFLKWRDRQINFCKKMNLTPSNTVIFGIDHQHKYQHYNRGMANTNRLCFSLYYESGELLPDVQ